MKGIELHNFRRFEELPFLEFGKITFLVGSNSSGKSSVSKAIAFLISNIRNMYPTSPFWDAFLDSEKIDFSNRVCPGLNIVDFKKTLSKYSEDGTLSIGLMIKNIYLRFDIVEDSMKPQLGLISRIQITNPKVNFVLYPQHKKCRIEFNDSMHAYPPEALSVINDNMEERLYIWKTGHRKEYGDLDHPACGYDFFHYEDIMGEMYGEGCNLPQYSDFCEISEKDLPYGLTMPGYFDGHWLSKIIRFFTVRSIHGVWNRKERMGQGDVERVNYYRSLDLLATELDSEINSYEFIYMPMDLLLPAPSYKDSDFANILQEVDKSISKVDGEIRKFICDWLREFNIGSDFIIKPISEKEFELRIKDKETDQWFDSTQIGRGALQIISILLRIGLIGIRHSLAIDKFLNKEIDDDGFWPHSKEWPAFPLIILEEPEICLHPCAQSKLVEMMLAAHRKFSITFIVETHSEYMIRRTQVMVAKKRYDEFLIRDFNPFKVYYFPSEGMPYDMEYRPNGRFERSFGKGFFDEATKWNDQLIWGITQ